jgi:hypothetical protein
MLLVVAVVIGALVASGIGGAIAGRAMDAVCQIAGQGCQSGGGETTSASELQSRLGDLVGLVNGSGGAIADLAAQAQAAIDRGDLDTARKLVERLEFYRELFESGPRGQTLAALVTPSASEFADLIDQGTIQADDDETNRRYFQVPSAPGQGILVMDLFIPGENAGPLKGDGRDFENPLRNPDLEETDSRVTDHHRPRDGARRGRPDPELHRVDRRRRLLQRGAADRHQRRPRPDRERLRERRHRRGHQPRRRQQLQQSAPTATASTSTTSRATASRRSRRSAATSRCSPDATATSRSRTTTATTSRPTRPTSTSPASRITSSSTTRPAARSS